MNHFHWSWADLSSPKEANVIVGEKFFTCYSGLCGVWLLIWTQTSGSPATSPWHVCTICTSALWVTVLAFYFKAAQWQVSREIGTFCLGWWNIILFWEGGLLFKGGFLRAVGPLSCSEWERGGCHPHLRAASPCAVLAWDSAESSPKPNHPYPHFSALSWDLAMLISSPSALHIWGNGKEFHSLVYPFLPFEFWCWLPLLATPLGVFWEILIKTPLEMCTLAFLLLPQPNKNMDNFAAPFQSSSLSGLGLLFHLEPWELQSRNMKEAITKSHK